jgi:hypothetical protein
LGVRIAPSAREVHGQQGEQLTRGFEREEDAVSRWSTPELALWDGATLSRMLVVDAANVIGSRPTGWWRDRPGAARRFAEHVRATVRQGGLEPPVVLVFEGQAREGAVECDADGVEVIHAPGEGDDTIAAIAETNREVVVVTADRELAERVRAVNAEVVGPSWLLDQLVG